MAIEFTTPLSTTILTGGTHVAGLSGSSGAAGASMDGVWAGTEGLSAEGLILYLQTRMNGLDEQINAIFKKMQDMEKIRKLLNTIQNELNQLNDDTTNKDAQGTKHEGAPQ
ncbi:MAG: hypothetical protein FWD57_13085, partial [Polyangiaceae bacterium]|nr:hypothetical protein [Polyangiaceae bacterium]